MNVAAPTILSANPGSNLPEAMKAKLKDKAQQFESFYIYQFIELMTPKMDTQVFNGGQGEEMFRHQLHEELANSISKRGGFGIADKVYTELLRHQEASQPTVISPAQLQSALQSQVQSLQQKASQ